MKILTWAMAHVHNSGIASSQQVLQQCWEEVDISEFLIFETQPFFQARDVAKPCGWISLVPRSFNWVGGKKKGPDSNSLTQAFFLGWFSLLNYEFGGKSGTSLVEISLMSQEEASFPVRKLLQEAWPPRLKTAKWTVGICYPNAAVTLNLHAFWSNHLSTLTKTPKLSGFAMVWIYIYGLYIYKYFLHIYIYVMFAWISLENSCSSIAVKLQLQDSFSKKVS